MRYTKRELRLAILAALLAVAIVALLGLDLFRGPTRPPVSGLQRDVRRPTASGPVAPTPSQARVLTTGYAIRGRWAGGFNAEMVITNLGSQPVEGWTVRLQLPPGVAVSRAWSADYTQKAAAVTLRSQPWNTYLAPGATVHLGFEATGAAGSPSSCTVNGSPC
jgi:cellulase/cellobiase CelA1